MKGAFKITISPDGRGILVDVDGVVGTSCTDLSKVFTDLGNKANIELKNEYFTEVPNSISVNGG